MTPEQALAALFDLPPESVVLLLGATDTGKTTFAMAAASQFTAEQAPFAHIDCDVGQSEVGPPGTVGLAFAVPGRVAPIRSGRDIPRVACAFVGATSPAGHLLETVAAASRMARVAADLRPRLTLIDTPGWVHGPAARAFAHRLSEIVCPRVILAFGNVGDMEALLAPFRGLRSPLIWQISPSAEVTRKTQSARAARRAARFAAAFAGAAESVFSADTVALCGTDLFSGEALPHHIQQFISQSLRAPVLHAERRGSGSPYIVINGEAWNRDGAAAAVGMFHTTSLTVVPAKKFARLLVGLMDADGSLLDIGLIARIDFSAKTLTVLTPCRRPAAVAQVWCGSLRVRPDGREIATLRPGEV